MWGIMVFLLGLFFAGFLCYKAYRDPLYSELYGMAISVFCFSACIGVGIDMFIHFGEERAQNEAEWDAFSAENYCEYLGPHEKGEFEEMYLCDIYMDDEGVHWIVLVDTEHVHKFTLHEIYESDEE